MNHDDALAEEIPMTCTVTGCAGLYDAREVVQTVRQNGHILVIDHVPAEVCALCADVLFTPETVRRLEGLRQTTAAPPGGRPSLRSLVCSLCVEEEDLESVSNLYYV